MFQKTCSECGKSFSALAADARMCGGCKLKLVTDGNIPEPEDVEVVLRSTGAIPDAGGETVKEPYAYMDIDTD